MYKLVTQILFIAILSISGIFFSNSAAYSQATGLFVYPNVIELDFAKSNKQFVSKVLYVENTSDKPTRVRAYLSDWTLDENGSIVFLEKPEENSLGKYVKFNPREFDLAPGKKQTVRLTAKLPVGSEGEYRTIIFLESVKNKQELLSNKDDKFNVFVNLKSRFGVALYAYTGEMTKNISLKNLEYKQIKNKNYLIIEFENSGNKHMYVNGEATLTSNNAEETIEIAKYTILPNKTQYLRLLLPKEKLSTGEIKTTINLKYQDNNDREQEIKTETTFNYTPSQNHSIKDNLQKPDLNEEIKMTPDNVAKPMLIDETEIKLTPEKN